MKNKKIIILAAVFICIAFSLSMFFQNTGIAPGGHGREPYVTKVIDGDTIELFIGESVRYIGIDTPEIHENIGSQWLYKPRPYAEEAKEFNRTLVEGKRVRLEFDVQKKDKYNRLLAYVYIDGKMVNLEMVREGYAMIYTYPPNVKYVEEFVGAQQYARENNKGLWKGMEDNIIPASLASKNSGMLRMVEATILSTYLSDKVLILNCRDDFKIAIFRNNLERFPKEITRSPDTYFKYKTVRVYGIIKEYKGTYEIILNDPSQLQLF